MRTLCVWGIASMLACSSLTAAPIAVRFAEGVSHGFLEVRDLTGKLVGTGDQLQTWHDGEVEKRTTFHFKDGSLYDEKVTFTQKTVFKVKAYSLTVKGPAFESDSEVSFVCATGAYKAKKKDRKDGKEKTDEGTIELPPDVYNGLLLTLVKDLPKGAGETVHVVAFQPKPTIVEVELTPVGDTPIEVGARTKSAVHYVLKPRLGAVKTVFAKLLGKMPEDSHVWVAPDGVPSFVAFEGALSPPGTALRVEMVSPKMVASKARGTK